MIRKPSDAAAQEEQNHFEVLGLEQSASSDEARNAFLQLAKRLHPDRFTESAASEVAAQVFARITLAHETLFDPKARDEYQQALAGGAAEERTAQVNKIMSAESQFQQGVAHFKKREYGQALEKLQWAVEMNPEEGEFQALYGWTYFLHHRGQEDAARKALESLQRGIELAATHVSTSADSAPAR